MSEITNPTPMVINPEKIGTGLEEVSVDYLEVNNQKIKSRWLRGGEAELFIWTDQYSNIIKQQMTLFGQIVEWNIYDGVRTGLVIESDLDVEKPRTSESVKFDSKPQGSAIKQASVIVSHVISLSQAERDLLISNFGTRGLGESKTSFFGVIGHWLRKVFS